MDSKATAIINAAKALLGTPYVWGGDCDKEGGLDCSGYVYKALNTAGIKVARDTAQGYYNKFKGNKAEKSTVGALLFFGKDKAHITHVAISAGTGKMYESIGNSKNSINNKGKGVTLSQQSRRRDFVAACMPYKVVTSAAASSSYYPKYSGSSNYIDVVFKAIGAPYGNKAKRLPVAKANGYSNYGGLASQNLQLIKLAKAGTLKRY